jgi:arginyl-tRNA synthetase
MDTKIAQLVHELYGLEVEVKLTRPDPQFGDYATNVALQIAGEVGKNPRQIAVELMEQLQASREFGKITIAGPGFLNITLGSKDLLAQLQTTPPKEREGQTVVIETNNPNPFKAMHIGHAFNAILADTIANLIETDGAHTYRVSYHGDVGLHVGKSMYSLLRYVDGDIERLNAVPKQERNSFMSRMYAEGSKAYKEDEAAKAEINDLAQQSFEPKSAIYIQVYDLVKAWSFEQIDSTVARLGNKPTKRQFLESDADMRGVQTVRANVPRVFQESDGALVFKGSEHGAFDNAFVASNGRGLYAARDLGLMQLKNEYFHPQKSYIVTAEEQRDYFKGVIAAAELCLPDLKGVTVNISTGTVKLSSGKMSSRDGDVVEIGWLFDQFQNAITERGGEPTDDIAAGALRYQFLKVKIGSDVTFDINEAVSLQGNTGSYIQYAHARARSILAKVEQVGELTTVQAEDRAIVRKLGQYSETVAHAQKLLEPHHICTYLFELAQEFNRYYELNQVIGSDQEAHRVALVKVYADTLQKGLGLLGIAAPDKM